MAAMGGKLPLAVLESFCTTYRARMPKRRLTDPPAELQWCLKCRKVLGDYGGWFGGQCFCGKEPEPGAAVRDCP